MINILPDEIKSQKKAARINGQLLNYITILLFSLGFLAIACGTTYYILKNIETKSQEIIKLENEYSQAMSKVSDINNSLDNVQSIMNNDVIYSNILLAIGKAIPAQAIIKSLSINEKDLSSPVTIKILSKSSDIVSQLGNNFSNPIFSNYNLVETNPNSTDTSGYPVEITITVLINRNFSI
ncbi:MAG TPA: hypothetical protein PLO25_01595 [Candidatus Saccharibacteria bacterium]|nr:hypothetical protein [Candidatus Saccharibacteria bacterium]